MSAELVLKSLEIVDPNSVKTIKKTKKVKHVFDFINDNQKIVKKIKHKGRKETKHNILSANKKRTINEAIRELESRGTVLDEKYKKFEEAKQACKVKLDKIITKQIVERAVTRRPIKYRKPKKSKQKTAFTEEDFKKFEKEYMAS